MIPPRKNRKKQRKCDTRRYKLQNVIEWTFGLLKQFRRCNTPGERVKLYRSHRSGCSYFMDKMTVDTSWVVLALKNGIYFFIYVFPNFLAK